MGMHWQVKPRSSPTPQATACGMHTAPAGVAVGAPPFWRFPRIDRRIGLTAGMTEGCLGPGALRLDGIRSFARGGLPLGGGRQGASQSSAGEAHDRLWLSGAIPRDIGAAGPELDLVQ